MTENLFKADVVIFDPKASYEISAEDFVGKNTNMPYEGMKVKGKVVMTILEGKITYEEQKDGFFATVKKTAQKVAQKRKIPCCPTCLSTC